MADEKHNEPEPQQEPDAATATKPARKKQAKPSPPKADKLPPYKVLLHNDEKNFAEFVVLTILELTPLKEFEALRRTAEAHRRGVSLLLTTHKERAELYQDQFKTKGLTVTIEPA